MHGGVIASPRVRGNGLVRPAVARERKFLLPSD